jgi:DNA-binding transcriptional regulator of glucitol operon
MSNYYVITRSPDYLEHHGILGMKWGIRRYQNKDGSLTPEGRARYGDVLTKKQMQGYIKDYNLRTGSNKTINKNTVFKTPNGMYDYKGRKMNTETTVEDPMNKTEKKTETKPKKLSEMTDEELRNANQRMQAEEDYKRHLANSVPPEKVTFIKSFMGNLKGTLAKNIPDAIGNGINTVIANAIKEAFKEEKPEDTKKTNTSGSTSNKTDKELNDTVNRLTNEVKAMNQKKILESEYTRLGEEYLQDYWVPDKENNRMMKLVERSEADMNGRPLNQEYYRYLLDEKK